MKKISILIFLLVSVFAGVAQNAKGKKVHTTKPKTVALVAPSGDTGLVKKHPSDTHLISVVTLKKDTLFFNRDESVTYTIKQVWDMNEYPDRPVILFVSNSELLAIHDRVYGKPKPIRD